MRFALIPMDNELVFEAKIVFCGAISSRCLNNFCLISKFSTMASNTRSVFWTDSSTFEDDFILDCVSSTKFFILASSPLNNFLATLAKLPLMIFEVLFSCSWLISTNVTLFPACAATLLLMWLV